MKKLTIAMLALLAFSFSTKAQVYVSTAPAHRNVIIEEFTGRNCPYCPEGHAIANQITAANPDRVFCVNLHTTGSLSPTTFPNLNTSVSTSICNGFFYDGIPSGVINRSTPDAQNRGTWANLTSAQLSQTAECNVAGMVIVNPITRLATITVEVYYTDNSSVDENYLTIVMLQDSIMGAQSGSSSNPSQVIGNTYCHMHTLRDIISNNVWGDAISPTTQGTLITRTYEYQIPETIGSPNGVSVDLNNIHFLAWVSERSQTYDYLYQGQHYYFTAARPILNAGELEYIQGVDAPIYPIVAGVNIDGLYECTQSKNIEISIQNIGTSAITSMDIAAEYGGETYNTSWEGDLQPFGREKVVIPVTAPFGTHDVVTSITSANGQPYSFTSTSSVTSLEWSNLEIEGEQETLKLMLMQDKFGNQITWEFTAADGTVLGSGGPYMILAGNNATQIHVENVTVPVNECVKFTIRDSMGDGICCSNGNGYYIVKDSHNHTLFGNNSNGDFGEEASHMLSVKAMDDDVEENEEQTLKIYPNPTSSVLYIQGEGMTSLEVYNVVGQCIMKNEVNGNVAQINTEHMNSGIYFLRVHANDGSVQSRTFTVAR